MGIFQECWRCGMAMMIRCSGLTNGMPRYLFFSDKPMWGWVVCYRNYHMTWGINTHKPSIGWVPSGYQGFDEETCRFQRFQQDIYIYIYTLWETNISMENHHFSWENSLFQWPCSIAFWIALPGRVYRIHTWHIWHLQIRRLQVDDQL